MYQANYCVIDDDEDVLEVICDQLKPLGPVRGFTSPEEAINEFKNGFSPTLTILDLKMPGMSGLEVMARCRNRRLGGAIVLCSGDGSRDELANAINLGADYFLEKPFTHNQLREAVAAASLKYLSNAKLNATAAAELVRKNQETLPTALRQLCEVYFERIVLIENRLAEINEPLFSNLGDLTTYLRLQKQEQFLWSQIAAIENLQ